MSEAIDSCRFLIGPGAAATNTNSINSNQPTSTSTDNSLDSEITRLNNEANNLKADISVLLTFTPGNGEVKRLIEKSHFSAERCLSWEEELGRSAWCRGCTNL